jgi:hypothetical protein
MTIRWSESRKNRDFNYYSCKRCFAQAFHATRGILTYWDVRRYFLWMLQ